MSKQTHMKPLAIALGTAFAASLAGTNVANAAENPFSMTELSSGYQVAGKEGKCGEGKCGEGKCGGEKAGKEGKCGEGKCCAQGKAQKEGKCGEGKCGGKAGKEGKCGEGKCGGAK